MVIITKENFVLLDENRSMQIDLNADDADGSLFTLYPNPNDGSMNLIYSLNETSKGELYIYDISGRIITKYILQSGENNQILINETQLSNGIYFYKVVVDRELKVSDKIVIIK